MVGFNVRTLFCLNLGISGPVIVLVGLNLLLFIAAQEMNVAQGTSCQSFPPHDPGNPLSKPCEGALDGIKTSDPRYRWAFPGNPLGGWIQIVLNGTFYITRVMIMPLYYAKHRTLKDIAIGFDDNNNITQTFQASRSFNLTFSNTESGWVWEQASIYPPQRARRVRLTVLASWVTPTSHLSSDPDTDFSQIVNGINEIECLGTENYDAPDETTTVKASSSPQTTSRQQTSPLTSLAAQTEFLEPILVGSTEGVLAASSEGALGIWGMALVAIAAVVFLIFIIGLIVYAVTKQNRRSETFNGPFAYLSRDGSKLSKLSDVIAYPSPEDNHNETTTETSPESDRKSSVVMKDHSP